LVSIKGHKKKNAHERGDSQGEKILLPYLSKEKRGELQKGKRAITVPHLEKQEMGEIGGLDGEKKKSA